MVNFPPTPLLFSALLLIIGLLFFYRRYPARETGATLAIGVYSRETRAADNPYERAWGKLCHATPALYTGRKMAL